MSTDLEHAVYINLRKKMIEEFITCEEVARAIKISKNAFIEKMKGQKKFTLTEAISIGEIFFPGTCLDYLFFKVDRR